MFEIRSPKEEIKSKMQKWLIGVKYFRNELSKIFFLRIFKSKVFYRYLGFDTKWTFY